MPLSNLGLLNVFCKLCLGHCGQRHENKECDKCLIHIEKDTIP